MGFDYNGQWLGDPNDKPGMIPQDAIQYAVSAIKSIDPTYMNDTITFEQAADPDLLTLVARAYMAGQKSAK